MTTEFVRCSICGKRMPPTATTCPACGAERVPHVRRVRCRRCGRRVRADALACPNCGHNPRALYLPSLLGLLLLLCLGIAIAGLVLYNARLAIVATEPPATVVAAKPTAEPTWTPRVRVVLATETIYVAPTAPAPPTDTPTAANTLTPIAATPTPTRGIIATRPPAPTVTGTATRASSAPVRLLGPNDGTRFSGPREKVRLVWAPIELAQGQWYSVRVEFLDRADKPVAWCAWVRGPELVFPAQYYDDASPNDRSFRWLVTVMQVESSAPETCEVPAQPVSDPSARRIFYWY